MRQRGSNPPRRVWYLHHAESATLGKTYSPAIVSIAEKEQADFINRDTYEKWMKTYGHSKETVLEETERGKQLIWEDDIPF